MSRLARISDPETSQSAAEMAEAELEDAHEDTILSALHRHDRPEGWTAEDIATICALDKVQVGRRMARLVRDGEVDVVGVGLLSTGRMGRTFRARRC